MPAILNLSIPGLTVPGEALDLTPIPVEIPEIWRGLQFWLAPGWTNGESPITTGQYSGSDPIVEWQNGYYMRMVDAADRLRWTDPNGGVRNFAHQVNASAAIYPTLSTDPARVINGRAVLTTNGAFYNISITGMPSDTSAQAALNTAAYTLLVIYKAEAGASGAILANGNAPGDMTSNNNGVWFGFKPTGDGTTIWQHFPATASRLVIARDTATDDPVMAIISSSGVAGNVHLKTSGSATDHGFTFADVRLTAGASQLGNIGSNTTRRDIALIAQWDRVLSSDELDSLKTYMETNYGPF